ncbi:dihydrolipoamide acetyltransferase family protein [Photobacterium sp. TLY01]|uniref:dihydrolipoamide acetyltransferase family protein n=1 Tax=Photobacterium sp. TLY01 TaxID=2907534 RepID=UPI001F401C0E|nr:dihydrolipoamide acetyltransferase family protein [Photobacterium sp. TLY01]UIP29270.1 2-oxo acid dehydrogenase subunit E2 [Photobacterium sp. TLY01]
MTRQTFDIVMPALGADMRDGMLTEWLVAEGDHVNKGDSIAVIETNKGAIEMESYHTGTISRLLVQPMSTLPVGSILANIDLDAETDAGTISETPAPKQPSPQRQDKPQAAPAPAPDGIKAASARAHAIAPLASPVVRAMARQQQLNLQSITGSGPLGAILLRDLNKAHQTQQGSDAETPAISPATRTTDADANRRNQAAMRAAIGAAMEKSKREIPHYYLSHDVDLSAAQQWLSDQNAGRDPEDRLLLPALLIKAVATLLPHFPTLNGFYQNGSFEQAQAIHIGMVISLREGGLMVPAIHHADQLSLDDTMLALRDISLRSRTGRLRSSELTDATITMTNIGDRGCDSVFGVIYPPQVAILGFGRLRQSPQVKNNQIEICDTLTASLSADHRVSDGIIGAKFLYALSQQLQQPEQL